MSIIFGLVPYLEVGAIVSSIAAVGISWTRLKKDSEVKDTVVRLTRGNVAVQSAVLKAYEDSMLSDEEIREVINVISSAKQEELLAVKPQYNYGTSELNGFIQSPNLRKNKRFFYELAHEAKLHKMEISD